MPPAAGVRPRVFVIEDDAPIRTVLRRLLENNGYEVGFAPSGREALATLGQELYDVVLVDLHLPDIGGMDLLSVLPTLQTDAQYIVITGDGSVDSAVEAMRLGACNYLSKPLHPDELLLSLQRALEDRERRRELARLRIAEPGAEGWRIIGEAPVMRRMQELIQRVAPTRSTVLISGDTGTGKELVAREIHRLSDRGHRPFVPVNCSALPESLLESELFGHVKGSFTGAVASRRGLFEEAAEGTLFLDEISTVSPAIQVKLLRVLQERQLQRVGGSELIRVGFRLIAATNLELSQEVTAGRFREDLFYRLNVFPIVVPPLRDRRSDIPLLAAHFRQRAGQELGVSPPDFSPASLRTLEAYHWPGNVRQLAAVIERAVILHAGAPQLSVDLPEDEAHSPREALLETAVRAGWTLDQLERDYILRTLEANGGHRGKTADALGIDRRTLLRKLSRYEGKVIDDEE